MSWQLASLFALGLALAGGVAWFERTRPPSQIVALVAVLTGFAVAGRLILAPIPNAVFTTDIVLIAGYALGAAPGFMVGALAGLISNFWLGQGPWTPWQMAGWGLVGVGGSWLATIFTRRIGRIPLAVACGVAGIGFGVLMNFSIMATYGGEMSVARLLAFQARAVPFDLTHAIGNVILALIAGPALLRMLVRFRERFSWQRAPVALLAVTVTLFSGALLAPDQSRAADMQAAVDWIGSVQNADGGFGPSPGDDSSVVTTSWVMLGLAAAGVNPHDLPGRGGDSPVDYLKKNAAKVKSTADIARTILALNSAGENPRKFAGRNLITDLRGRMRKDGSFERWPNTTAISVIALRQAGSSGGLKRTIEWLRESQNEDGGWGAQAGTFSDIDSTSNVLQAIGGEKTVQRGLAFLRSAHRPSGGFPLARGAAVNSQSTAWAMQALLAKGINPKGFRAGGEKSPVEYLSARQQADGHFRYSNSSDQTPTWVTAQVMVASSGKFFPVAPPPRKPPPKPDPPAPAPAPAPSPTPSPAPLPSPAPEPPIASSPGSGESGLGGSTGGSGDTNTVKPRPIDPGAFDEPPMTGPDAPVTGPDPDSDSLPVPDAVDASPGAEVATRPVSDDEARRPAPSPAAPAGIGLGLAGLTAGGMWFFGRRRGW